MIKFVLNRGLSRPLFYSRVPAMEHLQLLYLLKHGRADDIRFIFKDIQAKSYPEDFPTFIDAMIKEHKIKRKNIAIRAGLSQDYTYKLLRGDKKTTERDYILAICIAIGMNLAQVQHALRIYGMPVLSNADLRSHIISLGISEGKDIDEINDWLEKSDFYLLRTSPDMPSAPIIPLESVHVDTPMESVGSRPEGNGLEDDEFDDIGGYEEEDIQIHAQRCGHAPMDYMYWGEIKLQNEEKNVYYVRNYYHPEGENMVVLTEEMRDKFVEAEKTGDILNSDDALEAYESLEDAASSRFFKWFLELDRETDGKVLETMRQVDDTRFYGARYGAKLHAGAMTYYMEAFNTQHPEKREYFQIVENSDERRFTVSHESYYMWLELGKIYPVYFGQKMQEPEYFIDVRNLDDLDGIDHNYKMIFKDLLAGMHQYAHRYYGAAISEEEMEQEKIGTLTRHATAYSQSGKIRDAIEALEEAYALMSERPIQESLAERIATCNKLAGMYDELDDGEQSEKWNRECYSYMEPLKAAMQEPKSEEKLYDAPIGMAYACIYYYNQLHETNPEKALEYLGEAIDLFEGRCDTVASWGSLANCLLSYAFQIDEGDPEKALEYSERALDIIRDQSLDRRPPFHWNRLASEEAVIYYGRAIDLIEGYLASGTPDQEQMRKNLEKEASELYKIYKATGKKREAERLTARMRKAGIEISEN